MATIKVAVRLRPFNQRELSMNSNLIIKMNENTTTIFPKDFSNNDPSRLDEGKPFTYDHSYCSFDNEDSSYISQQQVFNDLGLDVVDSAFEGYNAAIFAYGQTGSGKTYTMMGSPDNEGLIPRICQALFAQMAPRRSEGTTFKLEVSYLEIYNERVKDLLSNKDNHVSLKIREHPKIGPYVEGLSQHLVMDYAGIKELMDRGNKIRTTAATCMNDESSRSHAIFTLLFSQASFSNDVPTEIVSKVHLVDLAGSERADASGATGIRLKEGGHINKSLVSLGNVISILADHSSNVSKKNFFIPYRDSVLTWLLKDSLGGNSKTIIIANISPAACNYGETLSTLRYANRAKNIVNKPTINMDPNVKLIRDLKAEISHLQELLTKSMNVSPTMMEKISLNEAKVKSLTEEWTEKWKETHKILTEQKTLGLRKFGHGVVLDSEKPHLIGIDEDLLSTGITFYHLKDGNTLIGTDKAEEKQDIELNGPDIKDCHCIIEKNADLASLIPLPDAECYVNGVNITEPTRLTQGTVIVLGSTNSFRYNDPTEVEKLKKDKVKTTSLNLSKLSLLSRSFTDIQKGNDKSMDDYSFENSTFESNETPKENGAKETLKKNEIKEASKINGSTETLKENGSTETLKENGSTEILKESGSTETLKENESIETPKENGFKKSTTENWSNEIDTAEDIDIVKSSTPVKKKMADPNENNLHPIKELATPSFILAYNAIQEEKKNLDQQMLVHLNEKPCSKCFLQDEISKKYFPNLGESEITTRPEDRNLHLKELYITYPQESMEELSTMYDRAAQYNGDVPSDWHSAHLRIKSIDLIIQSESLDNKFKSLNRQVHVNDYFYNGELSPIASSGSNILYQQFPQSPQRIIEDRFTSSLSEESSSFVSNTRRNTLWKNSLCFSTRFLNLNNDSFINSTDGSFIGEETISIDIPSYIFCGSGSKIHCKYEVKITTSDARWTIFRRFKQFEALHKFLKYKYGDTLKIPQLPPKKIRKNSQSVTELRKVDLKKYLQELIDYCLEKKLLSFTKDELCSFAPFFQRGYFESSKHVAG